MRNRSVTVPQDVAAAGANRSRDGGCSRRRRHFGGMDPVDQRRARAGAVGPDGGSGPVPALHRVRTVSLRLVCRVPVIAQDVADRLCPGRGPHLLDQRPNLIHSDRPGG